MANIPLRRRDGTIRAYAVVDDEDAERINAFGRWSLHRWGYAVSNDSGKTARMHRVVMGLTHGDGLQVDHMDRDRLNNQKSNLRVVSGHVNLMNMRSRGGASQYRGVTWDNRKRKWQAQVQMNYKNHWLGYYETQEEAAEVAKEFRMRHGALD